MTFLYPIAWACCEGANVISPTREMIWYGIFDIVTGPLFLFNYVFGLRRIEFSSFGLRSGKTREQAALTEKPGETSGQSAISTNGVPGSGRAAGGASGTGVTGTNSGPVLGAEAVAAP